MEFPEGNASNCLCSVHRMAAGIDMPYQHASAARFETPKGALIFPRAQFRSHWLSQLCDSDEQQDFPSAPGGGMGTTHSCLLERVLVCSSTQGNEVFPLENGLTN